MGVAKRSAFLLLFLLLIAAGPSAGKDFMVAADSELDEIHAQGFDFLFDTNTLLASGFGAGAWTSSNLKTMNVTLTGQNSFTNSIFLSGNAQQSGLGVVNAVNSSVNMPINITVLINSQVAGGININNLLSAMRH